MPNAQISVIPLGLLSLLDIKNDGRYPDNLLTNIQPVIEIGEWTTETNNDVFGANSGAIAPSAGVDTPIFTIPDLEIWRIHEFCVAFTTAAGITGFMGQALVMRRNVTSPVLTMLSPPVFAQGIALAAGQTWVSEPIRDFWMRGGERFGCWTISAGGNVTANIRVSFTRMKL